MMKIHIINRTSILPVKAIRLITMKITIIGNRIKILGYHIIIPPGNHIGHGIMDVYIHHIGIHGTGVLPFMQVILITRIIGDMAVTMGDIMVIPAIRAHM
jgi:hypothetical protein